MKQNIQKKEMCYLVKVKIAQMKIKTRKGTARLGENY